MSRRARLGFVKKRRHCNRVHDAKVPTAVIEDHGSTLDAALIEPFEFVGMRSQFSFRVELFIAFGWTEPALEPVLAILA